MKINDLEAHIRSKLNEHTEHRSDAPILWEHIAQELQKDKKNKRFPFWIWLGLPVLLAAGALTYFIYPPSLPTDISPYPIPKEDTHILDSTSMACTVEEEGRLAIPRSPAKVNQAKNQGLLATSPQSLEPIQRALIHEAPSPFEQPRTTQFLHPIPHQAKSTQLIPHQVASENSQYPTASATSLAPIASWHPSLITPSTRFATTGFLPLSLPEKMGKRSGQWSLYPYGGLQYSSLGLSATEASANPYLQQLKEGLNADLGWFGGVEIQQLNQSGMYWSTGVRYTKDWLQLDYESATVEQVLKENVLLKVTINAITKDTLSRLYGDREVEVKTQHIVVHHNSFDLISLPVTIGWQYQKQDWTFGLGLGLQFHFLLKQRGRMLNTIEEFPYFNNSSPLYERFGYSVHMMPKFEYACTPKLGIMFRPELNLQVNSQLMTPNISALPFHYRASIGVRINW
ncbi:MAG: hypothetical protein KTR30_32155 [Saprospiraceae bacterium]|nr:hypothetical protein [Saprospiraceae bacterium]